MKFNRRHMVAKPHSKVCSIIHSPGHMVTHVMNGDIPNSKLAIL